MTQTALLLMDFQNGIANGHDTAVANAKIAADAARAAGIPIVFVRVAFRPGYPEVSANNLRFSQIAEHAGDTMTLDHEATQIRAELERRDDEPLVTKKRFSAFAGSDLDVILAGLGATELVLAGISTAGVVLSTLRQAADLDYRLTVLADACADRDEEIHRVLTEKVFPIQADVRGAADWAARVSVA